jgi:hypothetical protein
MWDLDLQKFIVGDSCKVAHSQMEIDSQHKLICWFVDFCFWVGFINMFGMMMMYLELLLYKIECGEGIGANWT